MPATRFPVHVHGEVIGEMAVDAERLSAALLRHLAGSREEPAADLTPHDLQTFAHITHEYLSGLSTRLLAGALDEAFALLLMDVQLSELLRRTATLASALRQVGRAHRADLMLRVPSIAQRLHEALQRADASELAQVLDALKVSAGVQAGRKSMPRTGLKEAFTLARDAIRSYRKALRSTSHTDRTAVRQEHHEIHRRLMSASVLIDQPAQPQELAARLLEAEYPQWGTWQGILKHGKRQGK